MFKEYGLLGAKQALVPMKSDLVLTKKWEWSSQGSHSISHARWKTNFTHN